MKAIQRRILDLWKRHPAWRATPREVMRALGLQNSQLPHVRAALERLVEEGRLAGRHGAYALPRPAAESLAVPALPPRRLEGLFTAHPDGYGFVAVAALKTSLFIPPPEIGGALDGDWVRVELIPARGRHRTSGRVAEVLERRRARVRGHVEREGRALWVVPLNERLPDVAISLPPGAPAPWPDGALVDVALTHFPETPDEYPQGRIVAGVSESEHPDQIIDNILANTSLHLGFSQATLREMADLGHDLPPPAGERKDLTGLPFFTIDPPDARDMDDAICVEALPGGRLALRVAIADVAAYVRPGSAVDADAYRKGTSVYFPGRVLPMLPEELSGHRCSLRPGEPRPVLVCEMEIGAQGENAAYRLYEALIHSRAKLTYDQVQQHFETGEPCVVPETLLPQLALSRDLAWRLRRKRETRGALSFVFPEARFELGPDGLPVRLWRAVPTEATRVIEQCMLEANETVARHCAMHNLPMLYRVHDPPPGDALEQLALQLWNAGIEVRAESLQKPDGLQAVLARLEGHPAREQMELLVLKAMSQAVYRETCDGHYALAATHYCHFTSPIRRYPDLLVHRALKAWLAGGQTSLSGALPFSSKGKSGRGREQQAARRHRRETGSAGIPPLPPDAGAHLSAYERIAADTEQQVIRLYRVLYMEPRVGEDFAAKVTGISERGLVVSLREEFVDGFLPLDGLHDDLYRHDPGRGVIEGRRHRRKVGLGQPVVVKLARADRLTQQLEFGWVAWGGPAGKAPSAREKETAATAPPAPTPVMRRRKSDRTGPLPGPPG